MPEGIDSVPSDVDADPSVDLKNNDLKVEAAKKVADIAREKGIYPSNPIAQAAIAGAALALFKLLLSGEKKK